MARAMILSLLWLTACRPPADPVPADLLERLTALEQRVDQLIVQSSEPNSALTVRPHGRIDAHELDPLRVRSLAVVDATGRHRITLHVDDQDAPCVALFDPWGHPQAVLQAWVDAEHHPTRQIPRLAFFDPAGHALATFTRYQLAVNAVDAWTVRGRNLHYEQLRQRPSAGAASSGAGRR